jgi:hypothetical protein
MHLDNECNGGGQRCTSKVVPQWLLQLMRLNRKKNEKG